MFKGKIIFRKNTEFTRAEMKQFHRSGKDRRDDRAFYGFVYRLHNGCLKVQEAKALRYELRERNDWLKFC